LLLLLCVNSNLMVAVVDCDTFAVCHICLMGQDRILVD